MKYVTFFSLLAILGAIIFFLFFCFSESWGKKRQKDTWERRAKEMADTVRARNLRKVREDSMQNTYNW